MQTYSCRCGNTLFYDNSLCLACGSEVGFCPGCRKIVALLPGENGNYTCGNPDCGESLTKCLNYSQFQVCNRCVRTSSVAESDLCDCCRFNDTIPDLAVPGNHEKWYRLEQAKRRLFYDLALLGLPYGTEADGVEPALTFDFKADVIPKGTFWRKVDKTQKVYTGHAGGRITINIREADDVEREKLRVDFGEAHRTLIGHFRHEVGHYYWDQLVKDRGEEPFVAIFGDHNSPSYGEALETYYKNGPAADWPQRCVSAYASMHPWEDFAETWAMYLDMISALDTAQHVGFGGQSDPAHADVERMVARYQALGLALNEINRSFGLIDVVPEVIAPPVINKLRYVHQLVAQGRAENGALHPKPAPAPEAAPSAIAAQLAATDTSAAAAPTIPPAGAAVPQPAAT